jgi:hypothetical protein
MGLDEWQVGAEQRIEEPRLLGAVQAELGPAIEALYGPPHSGETGGLLRPGDEALRVGVPVAAFPRWLLCPVCRRLAPVESRLFDLKLEPVRRDRTRYEHSNCPKAGRGRPVALPVRFVAACEQGHLDDFPWVWFVHKGPTDCPFSLRLDEVGVSGEVAGILVRCETCDARRSLAEAFGEENRLKNMPTCTGTHPHLRTRESCDNKRPMRAMLLGASNAWFPIRRSALSIPRFTDELMQRIDKYWELLQHVTGKEVLAAFRATGQLASLESVDDDALLAGIDRRRAADTSGDHEEPDLKLAEWEVLTHPGQHHGLELETRSEPVPARFAATVQRIVLVDRLREVQALTGFTRIESPVEQGETGDFVRVPLARRLTWVPATEVHGEGIFIALVEDAVGAWVETASARDAEFRAAHRAWRAKRGLEDVTAGYPGLRYVLLHSLSHALMRSLALESGYSQASIRERIYCREPWEEGGPMAGVLLSTAAPDSEGTLGGLVALGRTELLDHHLARALTETSLCTSDPLCAECAPDPDGSTLHGAACHACLFAPETSCERGNRFLDRGVLAPLISGLDFAYFPDLPT